VQLYFDLIHDSFHSLFHAPTFMVQMRQGNAPPVLLFGIMAMSARFSINPIFSDISPRERSNYFAKRCAIFLNLRDISLTTIQACVLLGAISIAEGEAAAESVYYSAACRIANILDLPRRPSSDSIEKEVNIRGQLLALP